MAKRRPANPFQGRWLIEHMDQWDVEEEYEELQPFLEFERGDSGHFQFGCVYGELDFRLGERDGRPAVEASGKATTRTSKCSARLGRCGRRRVERHDLHSPRRRVSF